MTLNINLPANLEYALRERATEAGVDIETYILNVVKEEIAPESSVPLGGRITHDEFRSKLDQIIQRHGINNGRFDDSRESIYAGRGE